MKIYSKHIFLSISFQYSNSYKKYWELNDKQPSYKLVIKKQEIEILPGIDEEFDFRIPQLTW